MDRTDTEVLDAFLAALPKENQEVSAERIGLSQSQLSRLLKKRREGEVTLQRATRKAMEEATELLVADDPVSRARREAFLHAAEQAQALADRLRALGATSPVAGARGKAAGRAVRGKGARRPPGRESAGEG